MAADAPRGPSGGGLAFADELLGGVEEELERMRDDGLSFTKAGHVANRMGVEGTARGVGRVLRHLADRGDIETWTESTSNGYTYRID